MALGSVAAIQGRISALESRFAGITPGGFATVLAAQAGTAASPAAPAPAAQPATAPGRHLSAAAPSNATASATRPAPDEDWVARLPAQGRQWAGEIDAAARKAGVDPRLLSALVWAESGFKADARSHAGAIGLAQLMPATARGLGVDPHDPVQNLEGGARFLRAMLDKFGSADLALAAYNAGPGRVAQAGGIPNIAETRAYVPRVLGYYDQLKGAS